jgi:hypothetical protein
VLQTLAERRDVRCVDDTLKKLILLSRLRVQKCKPSPPRGTAFVSTDREHVVDGPTQTHDDIAQATGDGGEQDKKVVPPPQAVSESTP